MTDKFTADQLEVLECGAVGSYYKYQNVWALTGTGRPCTQAVQGLRKRGYVEITGYRTAPGLSYTESGRAIRKKLGFA